MKDILPLSHWLSHSPERAVAVDKGLEVTTAAFLDRVQCWVELLAEHRGTRWAVFHDDALEFLAIVSALWQLQRTACVPGDNCSGTVERLADHVDGFVGQFAVTGVVTEHQLRPSSTPSQRSILAPELVALEIYSSGSTGEPKPISKTVAQLQHEVEMLELLWPTNPDVVVLATVSHQHLYGMMFRLFWPFSAGRPFERKLCEYTEDIGYKAENYKAFTLISSPSHLSRMNSTTAWSEISDRCRYVVSSAAPLLKEDSLFVFQLLDAPVREIYGSSETGAIAWRVQRSGPEEARWSALPKVFLHATPEGTLSVDSASLVGDGAIVLPDRVEFNDNGDFSLLGRVDRIVKVEGKRVSLVAMEQMLLVSDLVKQAKVLVLERKRIETVVALVLTQSGISAVKLRGRRAVISLLKGGLREHFENVVLPRRWRFVEQMPYNQQGKLPMAALQTLFDKDPVKWPTILDEKHLEQEVILLCQIPADLVYFDGHFSDNPILPGIVQVHWAEAFGRRMLAVEGRFDRLEVVKFQKVILPEGRVTLSLNYDEGNGKLLFKYESEKGVHSSGRICFI
ncbi:MAG: AMP-binding protein [Motiliproteus sp.]